MQEPARRFTEPSSEATNVLFKPDNKLFATELNHTQGDCFFWSNNILILNKWLSVNCTSEVLYPFIICEKRKASKKALQLYIRSGTDCSLLYMYINVFCIRIARHERLVQYTQSKKFVSPNLNTLSSRVLSAWTMHSNTVQNEQILRIIKWVDRDECQCFTSTDIFYMENKTWYEEVCSCKEDYPTVMVMHPKITTAAPTESPRANLTDNLTTSNKLLFSCNDRNNIHSIYQCDGMFDCSSKNDEEDCRNICSTHVDCTKGCVSPTCVCVPMYYQCALGGCVHRTFVCDGVVNCAHDDSDELMCNYQLKRISHMKEPRYQQFSLCNSFTKETFPNLELCLLVRDKYGVTKHCNNTEHLHYCADFSCPNHYKCSNSYCIPMHTVCDGVKDCPQGEDEDHCSEFVCKGYMRCKGMNLCLHPNYLCNGAIECTKYGDDEVLCDNSACPTQCECFGFTILCDQGTLYNLNLKNLLKTKVIVLTYSSIDIKDTPFASLPMIHLLNLSNSKISPPLYPSSFKNMIRLRILDLTNVDIQYIGEGVFVTMPSLTHLYMPQVRASILKPKTFHLTSLRTLQFYSAGIQQIEGNAFCYLFQLETLNISYNRIKVILGNTFTCLQSIEMLDLSNNPLVFMATSALENMQIISFSGHVRLCCYITPTSYCQIDNRMPEADEIHKQCQSLLETNLVVRLVYGCIGCTLTLLGIFFTVKVMLQKKTTKATSYILTMYASDTINGLFVLIVLLCDLFKDLLSEHITHVGNISILSYYLGAIPRISLLISRLEHLLLTLQMYVAICYVFNDYSRYIKNARFIAWPMCIAYSFIDASLLRHINMDNLLAWQPYQPTDYSVTDIVSATSVMSYDIILCLVVLILYTTMYRVVSLNEQRVKAQRLSKRLLLAKRLVRLTIGRVIICLLSTVLIAMFTFKQSISVIFIQLFLVFELCVPLIVNVILFRN